MTVIKAGTFCPVCKGAGLEDHRHDPSEFNTGAYDLRRLEKRVSELEAREKRLVAALETSLIGGNDIANMLIDRLGHDFASRFPPDSAPDHDKMGFGDTYVLWCVWRAMMSARAEIDAAEV